MKYLKYIWFHNFKDEPMLVYSELDKDRNETRKVEFYKGGKIGCANDRIEHNTFLGLEPFPSIDEINENEEFFAIEISSEEFEVVWRDKALSIIQEQF
jgi:hypothetical protein